MRALGVDLPGLSPKTGWDRRPYPPGQHGPNWRRRKESDYKVQLMEKQKLRFNYGVTEKQLRRIVAEANRSKQETGSAILQLLERRFDNAVFRSGLAPSIPAARQLINHGHFLLNGRKANIASIRLKPGDSFRLRDRSQNLAVVSASLERPAHVERADWLSSDDEQKVWTIAALPEAESVPLAVNVQKVIEFYSRA